MTMQAVKHLLDLLRLTCCCHCSHNMTDASIEIVLQVQITSSAWLDDLRFFLVSVLPKKCQGERYASLVAEYDRAVAVQSES